MGYFSIWSRTARWLDEPDPASPMKASRSSPDGAWPRRDVAARTATAKTVAAPRRRPTKPSAPRAHRHPRQLVAEVEALVLGVRVAWRVLHARQQAGRPAQQVGEGLHEPDRPPRPDHGRLLLEPGLEGAASRLERGSVGVGRPPGSAAVDLGRHLHAERRVLGELLHELLARLAAVHVRHRAQA